MTKAQIESRWTSGDGAVFGMFFRHNRSAYKVPFLWHLICLN